MPFKVTPARLELIADILCILGVVASIVLFAAGGGEVASIPLILLCLLPSLLLSYILYAIAKILQNTENILEHLKNPAMLTSQTDQHQSEDNDLENE